MPAAKLRASFGRVSVLLDSAKPIEGPLLARKADIRYGTDGRTYFAGIRRA